MPNNINKHKNILLAIILLLLLYPLTVSALQKINLFRSKVQAFSIVFPDGWQQKEGQTPRTVVVAENSEGASIIVQVFQAPAEVSLDSVSDEVVSELIKDTLAGLKATMYPDAVLRKSGTTYIANKKAIWMQYTYSIKRPFATENVKTLLFSVFNGSKMYQILCTSSEKRYDYYDKIFLNTVGSFVFEDASWYR